jgi:hypothetical protein
MNQIVAHTVSHADPVTTLPITKQTHIKADKLLKNMIKKIEIKEEFMKKNIRSLTQTK